MEKENKSNKSGKTRSREVPEETLVDMDAFPWDVSV